MMAESDRPLAHRRPDPAADRLQAEAVLVRGPDLPRRGGRDAPPGPAPPPRRAPFEGSLLLGPRRPRVPRPRRLRRPADPLQGLPAALRVHLRQTEVPRHPGGDLGAAPHAAIPGRPPHPLGQGGERVLGQQIGGPAVVPPPVAQGFGTERIVALRQFLDPARHEGQHLGDLDEGPPLRQQPDRLEVPRLGRVPRRPVPRLQLLERQMLHDPRHGPAPEPGAANLRPPISGVTLQITEAISRSWYDSHAERTAAPCSREPTARRPPAVGPRPG